MRGAAKVRLMVVGGLLLPSLGRAQGPEVLGAPPAGATEESPAQAAAADSAAATAVSAAASQPEKPAADIYQARSFDAPAPPVPTTWVSESAAPARRLAVAASYSMAQAVGGTHDFAGKFSPQGFAFELRYFLRPYLSVGFLGGWQVLRGKQRRSVVVDGTTTTATENRYLDAVPMLLTAHLYRPLAHDVLTGFVGLGLGAIWTRREIETGFGVDSDADWHFGLAPDLGLLIGKRSFRLLLSSRFQYAVRAPAATDELMFTFQVGVLGI